MSDPEQPQDQQPVVTQAMTQITIPVTIQTVEAGTQNQQIAIPIGIEAANATDPVALQQIQQHVQQQVQQAQLQQQQIQLQQVDVQQIQQLEQHEMPAESPTAVASNGDREEATIQITIADSNTPSSTVNDNGDAPGITISTNGGSTTTSNLNVTTASLNDSTVSFNDSTVSLNSTTSDSTVTPKKTSKWNRYIKRYNKKWESEPGLKEWIRRVPGDDTKVACRYCQNTIRAHHTELKRHAQSAKHKSQAAYVVVPYFMSGRTLARMLMKAVRVSEWGGPEVLQVFKDVTIPEPQEHQILIKVGAAGVNPVETYIRSGQYANLPSLPWTPGADSAGTVEIVGPAVTKFKPGDRVYTYGTDSGTYAEYTLASEESVYGLPDQLDFKRGAGLGVPYFTAYRALIHRARARSGHTVLVHGASGAVGVATLQFARAYGMTVIGTAGTPEGMDVVKKNGAHFVFNHRQEGYLDQIMTATASEGVDVIIEMLANVNLQKDLEILAPEGVVAVVGNRGTVEINPRLLMPKESSIVGVMMPKGEKGIEARRTISAAIRAGIETGWLKPYIGKEFPLEGAHLAHHDIINGNGALGRIVLVPS